MRSPVSCPTCSKDLEIQRLYCPQCEVSLEGRFNPCKFCRLGKEQLRFLLAFLTARGNIKEVERALGISYPTVRSRLNDLLQALGLEEAFKAEEEAKRMREQQRNEILSGLEKGEINAAEAAEQLRHLKDFEN